jgi:hypothetical protein
MECQQNRVNIPPLRAPLSRKPLGTGSISVAVAFLSLFATCCGASSQLVGFSSGAPKNYLLVHEGNALDFGKADCIRLETIHDSDPRFDALQGLKRLLRKRLSDLPLCRGSETNLLVVQEYEAGHGVCIDCGTGPSDPQSGFAFISVTLEGKPDAALAEWQYWRGGSARFMLEQFVFDLTNLYIHGVTKHF